MNQCNGGQYPEALMRIQERQGYCLLLDVKTASYKDAKIYSVFYAQDNDGFWKKIGFAGGLLSDFSIDRNRQLRYKDELLSQLLVEHTQAFQKTLHEDKARREEENRRVQAIQRIEKRQQEYDAWAQKKRLEEKLRKGKEKTERRIETNKKTDGFASKADRPIHIEYDKSICPNCGGKLQEKNSRYGRFFGCSNYPKCHFTRDTLK